MIMCCEKKRKKESLEKNMMTKVTLEGVMMKKNDHFNSFFFRLNLLFLSQKTDLKVNLRIFSQSFTG